MANRKRPSNEPDYTFSFGEPSYESYVFEHLRHLCLFLEAQERVYAFFGGTAVAAYAGHLPRKLHDIDIILPEGNEGGLVSYLDSKGFREQETTKARQANFRKFLFEDDRYQMIVAIFPGRFTLLDLADPGMACIGTYNFGPALERRAIRPIHALCGEGHVPVATIPIEDLIITKLWPTLEPKTVYDLVLLLASDAARHIDLSYFATRIADEKAIRSVTVKMLERFSGIYQKSVWSRGLPEKDVIGAQVVLLTNALR